MVQLASQGVQLVFGASYRRLTNTKRLKGTLHTLPLVEAQPEPASQPLSFTRPGGCNTRGFLSLSATLKHSFVFNRMPRFSDLGDISPKTIDEFDANNYRAWNGLWVSRHNPRFVLADIDKVDAASITAMLGLNLCFAIRAPIFGKPISVYLMGDHTWALWGWAEAAARGELAPENNVLTHFDDHEDIGITQKTLELAKRNVGLNLANVGLLIDDYACIAGDPKGIGSFIGPAAATNFLGAYFWVYGGGYAAPRDDSHVYEDHTRDLFRHGAYRYRYHSFPFSEAEKISDLCAPGKRIFDYDVDIAGSVYSVRLIAQQHLSRPGGVDCATIAISPQYGPRLNHIRKTMALLEILKKHRA